MTPLNFADAINNPRVNYCLYVSSARRAPPRGDKPSPKVSSYIIIDKRNKRCATTRVRLVISSAELRTGNNSWRYVKMQRGTNREPVARENSQSSCTPPENAIRSISLGKPWTRKYNILGERQSRRNERRIGGRENVQEGKYSIAR